MLQRAYSAEIVDPLALNDEQKTRFIDKLYDLHQKIFAGVGKDEFVSYVVDSPAAWTRIRIFKNPQNDWVGYSAIHRFHKIVENREFVIFRAEAGVLRAYRGRRGTLWFGLIEAAKYRLMHPFKTIHYLGSFVHPAVFYMFSRYIVDFYPRPDLVIPETKKRLMFDLAKVFQLEGIEGQNELVRKVGWITLESADDREFWQHHNNAFVRFFVTTNPGYINGNGLLTLMPLSFFNIASSILRFVYTRIKRSFFTDI